MPPVREVVVAIPAPRHNHREHKHPALLDQLLISARIVRAHRFGRVSDVELNRPAATRLQIYEEQPLLRPEQVAWVRLAVQQLLGASPFDDRPPQSSQREYDRGSQPAVELPQLDR